MRRLLVGLWQWLLLFHCRCQTLLLGRSCGCGGAVPCLKHSLRRLPLRLAPRLLLRHAAGTARQARTPAVPRNRRQAPAYRKLRTGCAVAAEKRRRRPDTRPVEQERAVVRNSRAAVVGAAAAATSAAACTACAASAAAIVAPFAAAPAAHGHWWGAGDSCRRHGVGRTTAWNHWRLAEGLRHRQRGQQRAQGCLQAASRHLPATHATQQCLSHRLRHKHHQGIRAWACTHPSATAGCRVGKG